MTALLLAAALAMVPGLRAQAPEIRVPEGEARVASIFLSQDLINYLLKKYLRNAYIERAQVDLEPENQEILLHGTVKIPVEELLALNLDPKMGSFDFQLAIQPKVTKRGHLLLVFPVQRTFFWPSDSEKPEEDRVVVPVQLLSLALASARGYLAAVSGNFEAFNRKERHLKEKIAELDAAVAASTEPAVREQLADSRRSLQLQLDAVPIERRQLMAVGHEVSSLVKFSDQGMNLNQELGARRNALLVKIRLGQLLPYLKDIDLADIRIRRDDKDGAGQNFFGIDIAAPVVRPPGPRAPPKQRRPSPKAPDVVIRLDQSLFESSDVVKSETAGLGGRIKDFRMELKDDGLHARGVWRGPLFFKLPFEAALDFVWTAPNQFELQVREVKLSRFSVTELARLVLDAAKNRLDRSLRGILTFDYVGGKLTPNLRATVNMAKLLPALPKQALTGITTRDGALILKAGRP